MRETHLSLPELFTTESAYTDAETHIMFLHGKNLTTGDLYIT